MPPFKSIPLRPFTGVLDTLSSADEIGFGGWRVVKNAVSRSARNRQKGGGFRRLFADDTVYTNQDLHSQLVDQLFYHELYSAHLEGGGDLSGYSYPYFAPSVSTPIYNVFPPADGPFYPAYLGNYPSGLYDGCPIFYPWVGYPYSYDIGALNQSGLMSHWKMDTIGASTPDAVDGLDLSKAPATTPTVVAGKIGSAIDFDLLDGLVSTSSGFDTGDITFGFIGWLQWRTNSSVTILGKYGLAGDREYVIELSAGQLRFVVSNNGTATTTVTHPTVLTASTWYFFAVWHDPIANTINIKVNNAATQSTAHSTGVFTGATIDFYVALDNGGVLGSWIGTIDSLSFFKGEFPSEAELTFLYNDGNGIDYPFVENPVLTGYPVSYIDSYLYTSCPTVYGGDMVAGYPYGSPVPVYSPQFAYDYDYCGSYLWSRRGCREAVTLLDEIVTSAGRKLIAGTMSRVYEYNQSSGNWAILASGLGNGGYTSAQCTCNAVRGMTATMGGFLAYTNNVDQPMIYFVGEQPQDCTQQSMRVITDLDALGITRAGGVVSWKGFMIFYDITEDGERKGGEVIWSDLEDPESYIESDTSFAGRSTIAVGETILNAAPIGNWLILYTDKSIIRVTLVGGEDVFNFERIHGSESDDSGSALKYKYSLINTGEVHLYVGQSDVYAFTQFDTRPVAVPWITRAAGFLFNGISETDATYSSVNLEACELVTGGWNAETREAFISWPTGENICPNVTLRLNLKYQVADIVDHGFTAFKAFNPDSRPTVGQWIEDRGICPRGSQIATRLVDGAVCSSGNAVSNPPLYIRNPEEDPDLPVHADSLCSRLAGMTMDDFCRDCPTAIVFIGASAEDFSLKQLEDDILYREMLMGQSAVGALNFDGSNDYASASGDSLNINGAFTVELVFKFKTLIAGSPEMLVSKTNGAGDSVWQLYGIGGVSRNAIGFTVVGGVTVATSAEVWDVNRWYHVAATFDGATLRIYKDGELLTSAANPGPVGVNAGAIVFGSAMSGSVPGDFSDILISEARLWSSARSASEILANYNTSVEAQSGLVGLWLMNSVNDSSGNGYGLTLFNGLSIVALEGVYGAYACTGDYYEHVGYDAVLQTGAEPYRIDDEKMVKRITLEAQPWPQAVPSELECDVAYGSQGDCLTWKNLPPNLSYECLSAATAAQHLANNTRPDSRFGFPAWHRGVYLAFRFRVRGIGGGGTLSAAWVELKPWGQSDH